MQKIKFIIICFVFFGFLSCNSDKTKDNMPPENVLEGANNIQKLNESIKDKPTAPNYYSRYKYYFDKGEYTLAMEDLNNALVKDSVNANYLFAKVKLLRKMHRVPQAIKFAQSAERYLSSNQDFYISMAEMLFILKEYQRALDFCNRALQLSPFSADAYFYKGLIYTEIGDTTTAISSFETTIEQNTEYAEAYNNLVMIYNAQKKYELAKQYATSGLRFASQDAFINYNAGVTFYHLNQIDTSAYFYKKAILADSSMYLAHFNLGSYYFNMQQYTDAVDYFENVIRLNKEMKDAYYYAALCHQYTENWDMAQKRFENGRALYVENKPFEKSYEEFYKKLQKVKKEQAKS